MLNNLKELYQYRALLWALTVRELRARYRASVLGFLWTFLNPTLSMLVYVLFFGALLSDSIPRYPYFIFTGLLPWIFFSTSVTSGTNSISERRDLLTKVWFPAQVLPATVVLTNLVNFVLSLPILIALGLGYGVYPSWQILFVIPVLFAQTLLTLACAYLLSALNVRFRDLQHVVANVMQLAFFATPVLWPTELVFKKDPALAQYFAYLNPMAGLITAWRAIFEKHEVPELGPLGSAMLVSLVLLWISSTVFERRREEFAEMV